MNERRYDLPERTFKFADDVRRLVSVLPKTAAHFEDGRQLIRSSGSVGANYIEANDGLGKKDLIMRIRICRKEVKESLYWLRLIHPADSIATETRTRLMKEAGELAAIFGSILTKLGS